MSEGSWTLGRVDAAAFAGQTVADNFKRSTSGVAAGTAGVVISTKPGRFYRAEAQNATPATAYFLQVFDKATAAVNGDTPIYQKRFTAAGECEVDLVNVNGLPCASGISIAISTTAGTLTLAVANDIAHRTVVYTSQT